MSRNPGLWRTAPRVTLLFFLWVVAFGKSPAEGGWFGDSLELLLDMAGEEKGTSLTLEDIGAGLKEALSVGSDRVVEALGRTDSFNLDPEIHIPLPDEFTTVRTMMGKLGMAGLLDDLELKLNRAAETATPRAKALFLDAISKMTFEDVRAVFHGPDDAATRYFEKSMSSDLAAAMRPIVERVLAEVGAVRAYDKVMGQYQALPFVPDIKADLTEHVVQKGMDGIFLYMAREEAAIRKDPAKRTTEILKRVFGSKE